MATKALFNHTDVQVEQTLVEDLIIEAIQVYGLDLYYLPKTTSDLDDLFGEDAGTTSYTDAYPIEMYVKNVEGFEGEGNFLQQFGMQISDQVTFTVAIKRFNELNTGLPRPQEGDLIWFGLTNSMFEVQFVEDESIFYQMGELFVFDLQCELFVYQDQVIKTGVTDIDAYARDIAVGSYYEFGVGSGVYELGEYVYQGPSLSGSSMVALVKDYSVSGLTQSGTPELALYNESTNPASGVPIIGDSSGASWTLELTVQTIEDEDLQAIDDSDAGDNWMIEQEGDQWIDFTETNPFSEEF